MEAPSPSPSSPTASAEPGPASAACGAAIDSGPQRRGRIWDHVVPFIPMAVAFAVALGAHLYYGKLSGPHSMSTGAGAATAPAALVREGDLAPDFTLPDAHGGKVTLSQLVEKGPVLIVYFMGYNCPRCVAHLTHLDERKPEFDAVAAQIVAMSPSTVTEYKDSIEQYGDFRFSLVADEAMSVARAYGLYDGESLNHGAIIVDRSRRVRFAAAGAHPYDDEEQLLKVLGDLRGK